MSFLHVTVKKKNSEDWICVFRDLSESNLRKKLVKPYRLGKSLYYEGSILPAEEISQIKINRTDRCLDEELKQVQEESMRRIREFNASSNSVGIISIGDGHNDYEINQCGDVVTDDYLSTGPGGGTFTSAISEFIRHPWVVRVFGGLLFLGLAIYLGLR